MELDDYIDGFRVVGCTAAVDARDNTGTNTNTDGAGVPIYWLDGNKVADDNADFYDGDWDDEANDKNEAGADGPDTSQAANRPYTGCAHNGTEHSAGALGALQVILGRPNDSTSDSGPISSATRIINNQLRPMYGLSQVFEVSAPLASQEVTVPHDWVLIPSGFGSGDKFRLLFLSSTKTVATSTDIADYNTFIQNVADAGLMELDEYIEGFRAVGCTADVDARDNTATNTNTDGAGVPIYWVSGNKVVDDNTDFYDGGWDDETNIKNESGTNHPFTVLPFTGCGDNGTEKFDGAISLALGAATVTVGWPGTPGTDTSPLSSTSKSANDFPLPMYGLSQVFEVDTADDDAGLDLTGAGLVVLSTKSLSVTEGAGGGSYWLVLDRRPSSSVTVAVGGHASTSLSLSPPSLTFTFSTSNWNQRRRVSVSAAVDSNDTNEAVTLTHTATSADADFDNITGPGVIVNVDDKDAPDYHIGTITTRGSHALALGDKPLPEEEYEVSTGSIGDFVGVAEGHVWRPSGLWGDPGSDTVWVVDPYHQGIHSLWLSDLKQGRIERRVASDPSKLDFRLNYRCHFNGSRASGFGNPSLTVMWGTDDDLLIANNSSGTLDVYSRGSAVSSQCVTKNVTSWAADGQSYDTEDEHFNTPFEFASSIDLAIGPLTVWGIWSDGTTAWLSGPPSGVYTIDLGTGQMAVAPGYDGHGTSSGLWSDGESMWVADESGWLRGYDLVSGARRAQFDIAIETYGMPPGDIWSDGDTIWVANRTGKIDAYRLPDRPYASSVAKTSSAIEAAPLTAHFASAPHAHDGQRAFNVQIAFSDDLEITPEEMRDHGLLVSGGRLTGAAPVDDRQDLWQLTIEPQGTGPVSIVAARGGACKLVGELCTADGRPLTAALALQVAGPTAQPGKTPATQAPDGPPDTAHQPQGAAVFVGGVDLEWDDVPGADAYDVQTYRGGRWVELPADGVEVAFYGAGAIISGLDPQASLWFGVRSANAHGVSDWSPMLYMNSTSQFRQGRRTRPVNAPASGAPVIAGRAQPGQPLWANTTAIEDGNGLDRVRFQYQWMSNDGSGDADIAGATQLAYVWSHAEEGKSISVRVSFIDRLGYTESLTSAAVGTIAAAPAVNNAATGTPTISGTAQVGEMLTADTSGIDDSDGLINVVYRFQWLSDDRSTVTEISSATGSTYTLVEADKGQTVKVKVSFADDADNPETSTSTATAAVAAPEPPAMPTGLSVAVSHHAVTLTWDDPQDDSVTGYVILRRDRAIHLVGTFVTIADDTGTADTAYTDDTVEPDKQYVYRIKAINEHGEQSEISGWVRGFTPAAPDPAGQPAQQRGDRSRG